MTTSLTKHKLAIAIAATLATLSFGNVALAQETGSTDSAAGSATTSQPATTQTEQSGATTQGSQDATAITPSATTDSSTAGNQAAGAGKGQAIVTEQGADEFDTSDLIGMNVVNGKDDDIGEIEALILDKDGRVAAAVVSVGGFLGLGEKQVGISWDHLTIMPGNDKAQTSLTKKELEAAPEFKTRERVEAEQQAPAQAPLATAPASGAGTTSTTD